MGKHHPNHGDAVVGLLASLIKIAATSFTDNGGGIRPL